MICFIVFSLRLWRQEYKSPANAQIFLHAGLNHLLDPLTAAVGADIVLGNVSEKRIVDMKFQSNPKVVLPFASNHGFTSPSRFNCFLQLLSPFLWCINYSFDLLMSLHKGVWSKSPGNTFKHGVLQQAQQATNVSNRRSHDTVRPVSGSSVSVNSVSAGLSQRMAGDVLDQLHSNLGPA